MAMLRLPNTLKETGNCKSTHYADIKQGLMTRPVKIGIRASAWPDSEIEAINAARIAGKSNEEIRVLVASLEANRRKPVRGAP